MSEPVVVMNLMANPKPISVSAWKAGGGRDISISMSDDGWMQMTNNTKSHDCFVYARIQLPAGARNPLVLVSNGDTDTRNVAVVGAGYSGKNKTWYVYLSNSVNKGDVFRVNNCILIRQ